MHGSGSSKTTFVELGHFIGAGRHRRGHFGSSGGQLRTDETKINPCVHANRSELRYMHHGDMSPKFDWNPVRETGRSKPQSEAAAALPREAAGLEIIA
jgi:hypothetical protein